MKSWFVFASLVVWGVGCLGAFAQEETEKHWAHESEAAVVKVTGNTKSESYSAKQKTAYKVDRHTVIVAGRYLQTKSSSIETARAWDASLRYENALTEWWSAFVQQGAESDIFAGYLQRDNTDLGAKYYLIKNEDEVFFSEAGVRSTTTNYVGATKDKTTSAGRLYLEYTKQLNESVAGKFWVEYLPNFDDSDAWLLNYEPSLTVMLSKIFSLKVSYLFKHHEKTAAATESQDDAVLTTSIVAKF